MGKSICSEKMAYILKVPPCLLNPEWRLREKDHSDIEILERLLDKEEDEYYFPILSK